MASNYCLDCKPLDMPKNCTACESFNSYISGDDFLACKRSNVLESLARNVLRKLETQGYCVVDRFHKEENALKILEEVKRIHKSGSMQKGQLSNSLTSENDRGDLIAWVKGKEEGKENIGLHIRRCDALFRELNKLMSDRIIEGRTQVDNILSLSNVPNKHGISTTFHKKVIVLFVYLKFMLIIYVSVLENLEKPLCVVFEFSINKVTVVHNIF